MNTGPLQESQRKSFPHAVKWAYASRMGQRCISLLLTFVLASVLGPKNFGTVAMAMAYILFIEMFVAQGMTAAIVQRKELAREHLDSVFWLVLAAGAVLTGASIALSLSLFSMEIVPTRTGRPVAWVSTISSMIQANFSFSVP